MPRDLALLGQSAQSGEAPGRFFRDQARDREAPGIGVDRLDLPFRIKRIEAEGVGDRAGRIGFRQAGAAEQHGLNPVVEAQHGFECGIHPGMGAKVAAGEQAERAERERAAQQAAAAQGGEFGLQLGFADHGARTVRLRFIGGAPVRRGRWRPWRRGCADRARPR